MSTAASQFATSDKRSISTNLRQKKNQPEIQAELGARHPTPSLGDFDPEFINAAEHERRDALAEPESAAEEAATIAAIEAVIRKTLQHARRGLEWVGIARHAEPEADAYEGMEGLVKKPERDPYISM